MCELALLIMVLCIYMILLLIFIILKLVPKQNLSRILSLKQRMLIPVHFIRPMGPHLIFDFSTALQARRVCIRKSTRNFCKKPKFGGLAESLWAHVVCTVVEGAVGSS